MIWKWRVFSQNQDFGSVAAPNLRSLGALLPAVLSGGAGPCEERLPGAVGVAEAINPPFSAKNWILADFGPDLQ
jgi:hypothetical protein